MLRLILMERAACSFLAQWPSSLGHAPQGPSPCFSNHLLKSQTAHRSMKRHLTYTGPPPTIQMHASIRLIGETDMDEAGQNRAESHHTYIGIAVSFDVKKGPSHGLLELLGSDDVLPLEPLGDRQISTEGC